MAVTLPEALDQLNIDDSSDELYEIQLFVNAANEWIATKTSSTPRAPSAVKLATLFLIDHLWRSQRGPSGTPLDGDEIVTVSGVGYAIPNRVLELLGVDLNRPTPRSSFPDAAAWPDAVEYRAP